MSYYLIKFLLMEQFEFSFQSFDFQYEMVFFKKTDIFKQHIQFFRNSRKATLGSDKTTDLFCVCSASGQGSAGWHTSGTMLVGDPGAGNHPPLAVPGIQETPLAKPAGTSDIPALISQPECLLPFYHRRRRSYGECWNDPCFALSPFLFLLLLEYCLSKMI